MLLDIRGIGAEFAAILWSEGLFRRFNNRRQIAAYAGLAPSPWQSGSVDREQGVSKAGTLGRVDKPDPEANCGEKDESGEALEEFVITRGDAA